MKEPECDGEGGGEGVEEGVEGEGGRGSVRDYNGCVTLKLDSLGRWPGDIDGS